MNTVKFGCEACQGTRLLADPTEATLPELLAALDDLDQKRDWSAKLIQSKRQDVARWGLGSHPDRSRTKAAA